MIDSGDPYIRYEFCLHNARTGIAGADRHVIRKLQGVLANPKNLVEVGAVKTQLHRASGAVGYCCLSMETFSRHFPEFAEFVRVNELNGPDWILKGEVHGLEGFSGNPLEYVSLTIVCLGFERTYVDPKSVRKILDLRLLCRDHNASFGSVPEVRIGHYKVMIAANGNQKLVTDGFALAIPDCWEVLRGILGVSADAWPLP